MLPVMWLFPLSTTTHCKEIDLLVIFVIVTFEGRSGIPGIEKKNNALKWIFHGSLLEAFAAYVCLQSTAKLFEHWR